MWTLRTSKTDRRTVQHEAAGGDLHRLLFFRRVLALLLLPVLLAGCGDTAAEEEEEQMVVLDHSSEEPSYRLIPVTREDIVLSKALTATWVQSSEQTVTFPAGGRRITKVHVHQGDTVKPGDVLIELKSDSLEEQIDELQYRIDKNRLQLSYLDQAQAADEETAYNNFVYNTKEIEDSDVAQYERDKAVLAQNYRYKREDLNDEIEFDTKKIAKLRAELSGSTIRSTMNGMVYSLKEGLEGSTSRKDEVVMTIVDGSTGYFEMKEPDYASYFREGEPVPLSIVYSSASGEYELLPHNMSSWGETQQFTILSAPDNEGIDVGTSGTLTVTLDRRDSVLSLPTGAIYRADGKPYVYILDDQGFRQINWIETGLEGNDRVEILSGLSEGDQVVR